MISKPLVFAGLVGLASFSAHAAIIPTCKQDSCLAVVSMGPQSPGSCKAFLKATVTPRAVVETTTVTQVNTISTTTTSVQFTSLTTMVTYETTVTTVFDTVTTTYSYHKRAPTNKPVTHSPTAVPKYASQACTNAAEYSSACSCAGATKTTITAPTPTTTKTITQTVQTTDVYTDFQTSDLFTQFQTESVTATQTKTSHRINPAIPTACSTGVFIIQMTQGPKNLVGKYAAVSSEGNAGMTFGSQDDATRFIRRSSCNFKVADEDLFANIKKQQYPQVFYFDPLAQTTEEGYDLVQVYIFSDGTIVVGIPSDPRNPYALQVLDPQSSDSAATLDVGVNIYYNEGFQPVELVAISQ